MIERTASPGERQERPVRTPRRVAVMPAYNEEATIVSVLERLEPLADDIIVVDDGSRDHTRDLVLEFARSRPHVRLICFNQNQGMSAAYYRAFQELGRRVSAGLLSPDDVVLTVDADGQHEPSEVDALVAKLVDERLDAVIARRGMDLYTTYKRVGNWIMSAWASLWAGQRLYDVESGYRVFRAGALLSALRFYKGYKYSETVEVAVILPHLGYRVDNSFPVPVPIFRSNTRIKDVIIDLVAMPLAWWRVMAGKHRPPGVPKALAYYLPLLGPLALAIMALNLLVHRLFLADDSMQNYSHVWYLSQQIFDHGRLPMHVSLLDTGRAMTFPYALVPYLLGAGLFEVLGDWAVTLLLVLAAVGVVVAAGQARPALRDPWLLLLFVLNPFFVDAIYSFQFATLWSALFFFLFVASFERDRRLLAGALLWLSVSSHPVMGGLAAAGYSAVVLVTNRPRLRSLVLILAPVAVALLPVAWMTLQTPALRERSPLTIVLSLLDSIPRRGTIFVLPFALSALAPFVRAHYRQTAGVFVSLLAVGLLLNAGPWRPYGGYYGVAHRSQDVYTAFFQSPAFEPVSVYRVVEPTEREDGMYRFIRRGAVLSDEFFSESTLRRSWQEPQYQCYAAYKGIDFVVYEAAYQREYHTNEGQLLQTLTSDGHASVAYADPRGRYTVYDVRPLSHAQPKPDSLRECKL